MDFYSLVLKHFRTELTTAMGDTLNLQCIWVSRSCVFKSRPVVISRDCSGTHVRH